MSYYQHYKIFIDPGHGGTDPGAVNGSFYEKDFVLDIAKHVRDRLASFGVQTRMSRETDVSLTPQQRSQASNAFGANIFVSVHNNSSTNTSANGLETWKHDNSSHYVASLAKFVNDSMVARLGRTNRFVKSCPSERGGSNIYVIDPAYTNAWAILPEVLFISNASDLEQLKSTTFRKNAGYAIADGKIGRAHV